MVGKRIPRIRAVQMKFDRYRGISLLSVVGNKCAGILADRVRKVNEGLIDEEQGDFRVGRGCLDQIFTLK